jgi:type II secretory pathway predicted ATPase ExeA
MFLDFYQMREQPFGVTPDPRFLFLGQSHREALASLHYGIESDRGFVALIAQPGLGKTTLTFQLLEKLQQASRTVFLFQTQCNVKELFHYLLNGLGIGADGMELVSMHNKLNQILSREMLAGRRFVLAVDEAQNLDSGVLEAIRLLSNFETSRHKMLQIVLIGQPQLAKKLASPDLEQLQQRISIFVKLDPFGYEDTSSYIAHRLGVAGYEGSPLFSPGALRLISEHSQGIPRKINSLCFSALSLGCAMGRKQVDVAMTEEVIADRDVELFAPPKFSPRIAPLPAGARPVLSLPGTSSATMPSKPAKRQRRLGRWSMGVVSAAACIAIAIGVLSLSPARIDGFIQGSSDAWTSIRNSATSFRVSLGGKSDPSPVSSSLSVQAAELPAAQAVPPSTSIGDAGLDAVTDTVTVQPGENLRQIILRILGKYDGETIGEIRKLNPEIADLDDVQAGQTIRFPRLSLPNNAAASADAGAPGKD